MSKLQNQNSAPHNYQGDVTRLFLKTALGMFALLALFMAVKFFAV